MRLGRCLQWLLLIAMLFAVSHISHARTWSSKDDKHRVEGDFVKFKNGKVHIKKADGATISISMSLLSTADQKWVRSELVRRRGGDESARKQAIAANSANQQWHQWRGPNRDGKSTDTDLNSDWQASPPTLLWSASGLGKGQSSIAIAEGKIFTMGVVDGTGHLIALDVADGSLQWKTRVGGKKTVSCTPTVDGDRVYGLSFDGDLVCADTSTGREIWRKSFAGDFGGKMMSQWGYAESPLVDGDRLICTPGAKDAMMVALDKRTGRGIWRTMAKDLGERGKDGAGYSSIVITEATGVRQYVQLVGRGLIGVSARSGRLLWSYNRIANDTANIPTPIVAGDHIFCSTGYGTGAALLRLRGRGGRVTAEEVYFMPHKKLQNHHGGMIQLGEYLYCGHGHNNGHPVCVHLPTGKDAWRPGRGPGQRSAAVSYADGHLYFRYENATMALIEATPDEYRLKGTFQIASNNAQSWPHPVIANGKLYLRDQHELHCYDLREAP